MIGPKLPTERNFLLAFRLYNWIICHLNILTVTKKNVRVPRILEDVPSKLLEGRVPSVPPPRLSTPKAMAYVKGAWVPVVSVCQNRWGGCSLGPHGKLCLGTAKLCPLKPATPKIYVSPRIFVTLFRNNTIMFLHNYENDKKDTVIITH